MTYTRTLSHLGVACLTPDSAARTCGPYWYCVDDYSTPQTAFRTRLAFEQWLTLRGLTLDRELPPRGTPDFIRIQGALQVSLWIDRAAFDALEGTPIVALQNGAYSLAKVSHGVEHHLNPNVADRPIFDNWTCRELEDAGRAHEIPAPIAGRIG